MDNQYAGTALFVISVLLARWSKTKKIKTHHVLSGSSNAIQNLCEDACHSLFYGADIMEDGKGFPLPNTVDEKTVKRLKSVHPEYVRLPASLYSEIVANIPTVCVDVICQRENDDKILLFYRRDSPAKGIWWLPGGRMLKGETFFDTAVRKIQEEMGYRDSMKELIVPIAVTGVWNTFFHDSNWDSGREKGRMGCQTVNISVFCKLKTTDAYLEPEPLSCSEWAVEAVRWSSVEDLLTVGNYDKYVRVNAESAKNQKLI